MQHDKKPAYGLCVVAALWFAVAAPALGADIELAESDYPKLIGKWRGQVTVDVGRVSQSAASDYTNKFALVIKDGNTGKFTDLKSGKSWKTKATIEQGKLMLRFAREQRPFTYSESGGESKLSLSFQRKKSGKIKDHDLVLVKQ